MFRFIYFIMGCFFNDIGVHVCDEAFKTDAGEMEVHHLALHISALWSCGAELLHRTGK